MVGVGAVTAVGGAIKSNNAKKDKKRIAKEAANMQDVPLDNIAESLKVSTLGAKSRQAGQSALEASQITSLQEAGTRGIGVGIGRVAAGSQEVNKDIALNLDEQQQNIDQIKAEDTGRIRMTKEQRNQNKLAALSSQYNAAADAEQQGYGNMIQGVGLAGSSVVGSGKLDKTTTVDKKKYNFSSIGAGVSSTRPK